MRRVRIIIALAVLGTLTTLALAQPAAAAENWVAWRRQFGTAAHDHAAGVAPDTFGNVYAAGYEDPAGAPSRIAVWRFTARGGFLWKRLIGPGRGTDCAVDRWGKLYVVGYAGSNVFVKKLSPTGALLFDRRLVATDTGFGGRPAVAVRRTDGRVYVTGGRKCLVWALSAGGSLLASAAATGTSADDVALGRSGDVYVVGTEDWTGPLPNTSYLRRLDATGLATAWTRVPVGNRMVFLRSVTADASRVFVSGFTTSDAVNGTSNPYRWYGSAFLAQYDQSGTSGWVRIVPSDDVTWDGELVDHGITFDAIGVHAAFTRSSEGWQAIVLIRKFSPLLGAEMWGAGIGSVPAPPPAGVRADLLGNVATDSVGNLYICGSTKGYFPPYQNRGGRDAFLYKMWKQP